MSSNQWLRLWHDMPNDPKWRTISRVSKQPISLVISTYINLLISASRNVTRGHADVTIEDLASALDSDEEDISSIIEAMQGRVLDGLHLSGWDKRQVKKEDGFSDESSAKSAAERKRAQREREKLSVESRDVTQCHDESRDVTLDKDKDKDKDKENKPKNKTSAQRFDAQAHLESLGVPPNIARLWRDIRKNKRAIVTEEAIKRIAEQAMSINMSLADALKECVDHNWAGFKPEWLENRAKTLPRASPSVDRQLELERRNAEVAANWLPPELRGLTPEEFANATAGT